MNVSTVSNSLMLPGCQRLMTAWPCCLTRGTLAGSSPRPGPSAPWPRQGWCCCRTSRSPPSFYFCLYLTSEKPPSFWHLTGHTCCGWLQGLRGCSFLIRRIMKKPDGAPTIKGTASSIKTQYSQSTLKKMLFEVEWKFSYTQSICVCGVYQIETPYLLICDRRGFGGVARWIEVFLAPKG